MSKGRETDYAETMRELISRSPIKDGKTWLRHGIKTQAGLIDLMILEGIYSKDEIEYKLSLINCKKPSARLNRHIDHLQNAERSDAWTGNIPHRCIIKEAGGKLVFAHS